LRKPAAPKQRPIERPPEACGAKAAGWVEGRVRERAATVLAARNCQEATRTPVEWIVHPSGRFSAPLYFSQQLRARSDPTRQRNRGNVAEP
jgi:hypothetical protein